MAPPTLTEFCRDERPQLVGALSAYCGDPDVAEEVAQEALARACDRWDEVRDMDAPGAWLYRVAVNITNTHYRRRRVERRVREQLATPERWHRDRDAASVVALREAIQLLPPRQRAAVTLRYLLDWPVADTADALGVSDGAVRSLTHRGISALREHFNDERRERILRAVAGAGGVAVVVLVATVAAALVLRPDGAPEVLIEAPDVTQQPWTDAGGADAGSVDADDVDPTDARPHVGSRMDSAAVLRVRGDISTVSRLPGPLSHYAAGRPEQPPAVPTVRYGARDRLRILGDIAEGTVRTGEGVFVMVVVEGMNFISRDGECSVTVDEHRRGHEPPIQAQPDVRERVLGVAGHVTCTDLRGGPADDPRTIHVDATLTLDPPEQLPTGTR